MNINNLKKPGIVVKFNDEPYQIVFFQHSRTARGGAFVRTKLKNLITGQTLEKTFNSSDKVQEAKIEKTKANFLYSKNNKFFFMNQSTYEQFFLDAKSLGGQKKFLKEGEEVQILIFEKKPVNIELPKKINVKVVESPPNIKGDSVITPTKIVKIETGFTINVPIFINKNDIIKINTETGKYVNRVSRGNPKP